MDFVRRQRDETLQAAAGLMDVALWSGGAVGYNELKAMSPEEVRVVVERVNNHLRVKAKANGAKLD